MLRTLVLLFNVWLMSALTHSISRMGTPWCAGALHEGCLLCGLCFSVHRFLAIACPSGTVACLFLLCLACACACDFGATAYLFVFICSLGGADPCVHSTRCSLNSRCVGFQFQQSAHNLCVQSPSGVFCLACAFAWGSNYHSGLRLIELCSPLPRSACEERRALN